MILRPYQEEAIKAVYDYWSNGTGKNPIVSACVGAGKSILISKLVSDVTSHGGRVLMLTHLQELIDQNAKQLLRLLPDADIGLFSAGLKRKDKYNAIIYAGIQSIASKIHNFDPFDVVLIDECHLVPRNANTRYKSTLDTLKLMNPKVKIVGFSGTPYRLDGGYLHEGEDAIFDGVAYDISIKVLIEMGFLCRPVSKSAINKIDTSKLHSRMGEFIASEVDIAVTSDEVVYESVKEIVKYGEDRNSWMIFACGVAHAQSVCEAVLAHDISCEVVTGDLDSLERDSRIKRFKSGETKCIVSVGVLTTGFDHPPVDMLAILRPTQSASLFVQMCGRGLRIHESKENCLILDFGENFQRFGTLDDVYVKRKSAGKTEAKPYRECKECHTVVHIASRECPDCGYEFPILEREITHSQWAYSGAILASDKEEDEPQIIKVDAVQYSRHTKIGSPDSLKVSYQCGLLQYHEWVCLEHSGYAKSAADRFVQSVGGIASTVGEAEFECDIWDIPKTIAIKKDGKYTKILSKLY